MVQDEEKAILEIAHNEPSLVMQIERDCYQLGKEAGMTGERILAARCLYYERRLVLSELDREQDNVHPAARLVDELIKLYEKEKR